MLAKIHFVQAKSFILKKRNLIKYAHSAIPYEKDQLFRMLIKLPLAYMLPLYE